MFHDWLNASLRGAVFLLKVFCAIFVTSRIAPELKCLATGSADLATHRLPRLTSWFGNDDHQCRFGKNLYRCAIGMRRRLLEGHVGSPCRRTPPDLRRKDVQRRGCEKALRLAVRLVTTARSASRTRRLFFQLVRQIAKLLECDDSHSTAP